VLQRTAEGYGIFNGYGKQLHAYQFDYLYGDDDVFDQRFIRYKQGEIKGYLTWPEMTNHPVPYSYCGDFSNAMAVVKKDTLYGYIDTTFRVKIKTCYRRAETFSEGFAAVQNEKKKWAFINKKGKKITPFKYDKVYPFSNGRAAVRIDSLVGFINFSGQEVIPLVYQLDFEHDWSFKRGYGFTDSLCFIRKNGKYGLIDIDGNTLLPFEYDNVSFVDAYRLKLRDWHSKNANYALMSKGKYIFAVNNKGELIPNSQSTRLTYFIEGKSYVCDNDSSCRFINSDGDIIFPKTYDYYEYSTFNNGFCVVKKNDKFGIIDQSGNVIIPVRYDKLNNFSNNICKGVIGNAVYFINQKAEHVLEIPLKQSAHSE
jgi:hypothetical protein